MDVWHWWLGKEEHLELGMLFHCVMWSPLCDVEFVVEHLTLSLLDNLGTPIICLTLKHFWSLWIWFLLHPAFPLFNFLVFFLFNGFHSFDNYFSSECSTFSMYTFCEQVLKLINCQKQKALNVHLYGTRALSQLSSIFCIASTIVMANLLFLFPLHLCHLPCIDLRVKTKILIHFI